MYETGDKDEPKKVTIEWYWRPEAIDLPLGVTTGKYEVFRSVTRDPQSIDSLERGHALPPPRSALSLTLRPLYLRFNRVSLEKLTTEEPHEF